MSAFGYTYIYTFENGKNHIVWFTAKELDNVNPEDKVSLTGTVVKHQNYQGYNTTVMNRCIIRKEV